MHKVKSIRIERAEGTHAEVEHGKVTCTSWEQAETFVRWMSRTAPANGGYDKTDVRIEWENGDSYSFRFDMQREHAASVSPLRSEVRSSLEFYAGRHCPIHMERDEYPRFLERLAGWAKVSVSEFTTGRAQLLDNCEV